jgi:glycine/D-amino acid oxidase-like deaminating enzyme
MALAVVPVTSDPALPARADAVVIGGGIVGAAAALYLAKKGLAVALVEKGRIGAEQSSRNWGWCRQQGRDRGEIPLMVRSMALWDGMAAETGTDVGFRRTGVLFVTREASEVAAWERWLEDARPHQIGSRLLTPEQVAELMPGCVVPWRAGLYTPGDGRAEPSRAAPALAEAARRAGASIHQDCAARGLETQGGAVSGVITEKGGIRTGLVLCAGGAWSSLFCRRHGIRLPQLSVKASVARTTPVDGITEGAIASDSFCIRKREDGGLTVAFSGRGTFDLTPDAFRYLRDFWPTYMQRRRKLRLRFGRAFWDAVSQGNHWALDRPGPFELVRVWDPAPDPSLLDLALTNLRAAYPGLATLRYVESWGGAIDATPDAVPVISAVDALPGFFLATGFSGHGFGIAPGAGHLAADLMTGDSPIVDPHPFRHSRMIDGTRLSPDHRL